ncbi:hypothetical protein OZX62_07230 [Bifidobacterium sp. ESL0690]|uniref:hypothetical protein n=1 Tax=Bifidobacterium sp. ESL0690 TaxID=2983214 RepID=UPI0023F7691C|nr:hypothetical protein [Bifidobacterium sp. ESL0690]WEV46232.1 hypothetical protein OZX62_07230 [Bifidobacterium sp. ESL0690]
MSERRDDDEQGDDFKDFGDENGSNNVNDANDSNASSNANDFNDSSDENGGLFSDEELQEALAGFEKEFADDSDDNNEAHNNAMGSDDSGNPGSGSGVNSENGNTEQSDRKITDELDQMDFDEELEGLIGNRAKVAILITRLISSELLAAFCQIADISADCMADENGAVAILHNLDGDAPENAARDLTQVVNGMPVVLSVNRADKLVSTLYVSGEPGQQFAPPVLFTTTPRCVEDLMLGITTVAELKEQSEHIVATADFDRKKALGVIADHTRSRGRGKPSIQ